MPGLSRMGDARAQEPPPWCVLPVTAVVRAPGVEGELQQSRGQRLLDAPVPGRGTPQRRLLLGAVPGGMVVEVEVEVRGRGVARQARAQLGAVVLFGRGEQDEVDAVQHGVAAENPLAIARTAEVRLPLPNALCDLGSIRNVHGFYEALCWHSCVILVLPRAKLS